NSISELGSSLTCALAFVPVERSLRPRVGLFAPLRDKVTSSAQPLPPLPVRPSQGSSLSILPEPHDELVPFHVWMAPAWQEITSRAAQRSLVRIHVSPPAKKDRIGEKPNADAVDFPVRLRAR